VCSARGLRGRLGAAKRRMLSLAERPVVAGAVPLMAAPLDVAEGIVSTEIWSWKWKMSVIVFSKISGG
jgi:hypothetical protein